jgi:hypothetical protein
LSRIGFRFCDTGAIDRRARSPQSGGKAMSDIGRDFLDEPVESTQLAARINRVHLEPRCRVCRNDLVRKQVNDLLACGWGYAMILRAIGEDNAVGYHRLDPQPR